ncbi:hypothetical protein BMS3Abin09_00310 [bacterium BMS3Abin09]|nr:hypothetical protein BMS3Abin09_00310 [bacterium BMS3Abin09]
MYTEHFGLKMLPFENVPDPVFFFDEGEHARIRQRITESLKAGRGLVVVTGPIGSGKTTLSQMIKSYFSSKLQLIWMAMPPVNRMDLYMFIARELGLTPSSTETVFVINEIRDALLKINSEDGKCMIIIDESHMIADDVLDAIRILNNLEEGSLKLIQILLLGQDELMDIIKRPEMEPFRQRIATLEMIGKMDTDRIKKYVSHRIQIAGGDDSIFSETGWEALCKAFGSGNTPRTINSLCDKSLNIAFERGKNAVDVDDIYDVAKGMGLSREVFHYRLELMKKGKDAASTKEHDPVKDETSPSAPLLTGDVDVTSTSSPDISKIDRKSLKIPLLVLFVSIVTFIMSISSYCDTSGSSSIMTCLQQLFF